MAETKINLTKKTTSSAKKTTSVKTKATSATTKKTTVSRTTTKKVNVPKQITTTNLTQKKKPTMNINQRDKETNAVLTVVGIIALVVVAILIFRLTYAYFTATIKDTNPDKVDAIIQSADLLVRYQDGESNVDFGDKIEPGDIITKEFSVINDGNDTGEYTIVLQNIKHNLGHQTFEEDEVLISDLKYTLAKIDSTDGETILSTGTLPFEKEEDIIYTKDSVDYQQTNKYILRIEYINYPNIDQSDSMGENLELKVNIINYEGEQRTQDTEY